MQGRAKFCTVLFGKIANCQAIFQNPCTPRTENTRQGRGKVSLSLEVSFNRSQAPKYAAK